VVEALTSVDGGGGPGNRWRTGPAWGAPDQEEVVGVLSPRTEREPPTLLTPPSASSPPPPSMRWWCR